MKKIEKKKRTKWLLTHRYRNDAFIRAGIISNNPVKCDVIAFEHTYTDHKTEEQRLSSKELSIDEALVWIQCLARAVSNYTEHNSKINLKPK